MTLYFFVTYIILLAMLFIYSNGAWIGVIAGLVVFILFAGRKRSSFLVLSFIFIVAIILITFFPYEISTQLQHASNPTEVTLRLGAWHTALQTIQALPLTGTGLGYLAYQLRTEPFSGLEHGVFS